MKTLQSINDVLNIGVCCNENVYNDFAQRIKGGSLTRDENSQSHFCTYFLPYNSKNKKVFIIHHKKSGLWLSPGGHVDKGETLFEAVNRETNEELGVKNFFKETPLPFLMTVTLIESQTQPCKKHFDVWYLLPTDGEDFNVDLQEFYDTQWLTINEAKKIITNPQNIAALDVLEKVG